MHHLTQCFMIVFCSMLAHSATASDTTDWPRWRGAQDIGSIATGNYPANFESENLLWKVPLPGKGCSTPIVLNNRIYVTAPADGNDALLAFDNEGKQLWQSKFGTEKAGKHRNGSGSNSSPITDGSGLFVYFKSGTLAAVELNGTSRWSTNLVDRFGPDTLYWDHGTSPVLTKKHVIMARMHHGESWLAAFDKTTGHLAWKVARNFKTPQEGDHGYASPLVIKHNGKESLLVWGAQHLTIHDAQNGEVLWTCGNFNPENQKLWPSIATPVIVDDIAVIAFGRNDRGKPRLHGIRLSGSGDVTRTNHVWGRDDVGTFVPSPAAYNSKIFLVRDRGEVECLDPATGKTIWSDRLPKHRTNYYASPLIAGGKMYAPREDGMVYIADIVEGFSLLSTNDMKEPVIGSPVPSANRIFLRGENHLYCFGESSQ